MRPINRVAAALILCGLCVRCATSRGDWETARTDPFSLSVQYPRPLFPNGFVSRARDSVEWVFGPNKTGASLLLRASYPQTDRTPYQAACSTDCPGETYHLNEPALGVSSGQIGEQVFYSKCMRHGKEMHCLHLIYPVDQQLTYATVVQRMSESLR